MPVDLTAPLAAPEAVLAGYTVLQIIPELDAGGAERTTIDIAAALAAAGARALVASRGGRLVSELQAKGGVFIEFPAKTKNPFAIAANVARLAQLIRRERIAIVHARSRAPAWAALGAARMTGVPLVTTYHGAYGGTSTFKTLYNSVMARGDAVIANSDFTAARIERLHGFAKGRLRVIHRGTDFQRFAPGAVDGRRVQALRAQWGVAADETIILLPGRLTSWKGQPVLIKAARLLAERGFGDTKIVLAGDAQGRRAYRAELQALATRAGLGDSVKVVGHCEDMPAAFRSATVVVVASTQPEAFGRVAVEAQAMGVPVIVSDLGAVPETVLSPPQVDASQRTGWRVPAGDPTALADALVHVLSMGASARDALAARARAHVEARFSIDRMCAQTLDVYAALIERRALVSTGAVDFAR